MRVSKAASATMKELVRIGAEAKIADLQRQIDAIRYAAANGRLAPKPRKARKVAKAVKPSQGRKRAKRVSTAERVKQTVALVKKSGAKGLSAMDVARQMQIADSSIYRYMAAARLAGELVETARPGVYVAKEYGTN